MDEKCLEQYMVNYNDDFIIRYGEYDSNAGKEGNINRTFYMTFKDAYKQFNEMKTHNKIVWAQLIFEDLDIPDHQEVIMEFEKEVIDFGIFGKVLGAAKSK